VAATKPPVSRRPAEGVFVPEAPGPARLGWRSAASAKRSRRPIRCRHPRLPAGAGRSLESRRARQGRREASPRRCSGRYRRRSSRFWPRRADPVASPINTCAAASHGLFPTLVSARPYPRAPQQRPPKLAADWVSIPALGGSSTESQGVRLYGWLRQRGQKKKPRGKEKNLRRGRPRCRWRCCRPRRARCWNLGLRVRAGLLALLAPHQAGIWRAWSLSALPRRPAARADICDSVVRRASRMRTCRSHADRIRCSS